MERTFVMMMMSLVIVSYHGDGCRSSGCYGGLDAPVSLSVSLVS